MITGELKSKVDRIWDAATLSFPLLLSDILSLLTWWSVTMANSGW
ncbi:MAG: hypothetical protein WBQ23_04290 [Bacteroidota bacterium]